MVEGISHITFVVNDLEKMKHLIIEVLGGEEVYSSGEDTFSISKEKFFLDNHLFELHTGTLEDRLRRYTDGP
ncbi:MAG: hypothetical protein E4H01_14970 [Lysobacterales bacterium]|nr:MAG: hypothetical protein E4H01_14970 [Xanthomonadales bacterium]